MGDETERRNFKQKKEAGFWTIERNVIELGERKPSGYTSQTRNPIASATKWVTGSTILRLVQQGTLSLATRTGDLLVDRKGAPWSGPIGQITLSDLLSFTSGLEGDVDEATATSIKQPKPIRRLR
jgi:CubicO group peptidase (beta-lactamase class C family)